MRFPCEIAVRELLPFVRAYIAKILIEKYKWKQQRVAEALWISQASVSKYKKILRQKTEISPTILKRIANYWGEKISKNEYNPIEFIRDICHQCYKMRIEGDICRIHRGQYPFLADFNCNVCSTEFLDRYQETGERIAVLNDLKKALELMKAYGKIVKFIPEVRTNVAVAIQKPQDISDVAAFPGRITVHKEKILAIEKPEFGASTHMASILLEVNRYDPSKKAVTCIKYNKAVEKAITKLFKNVARLDRRKMKEKLEDSEMVKNVLQTVKRIPDIIIDEGTVGIEPVVYFFAENGESAVKKVIMTIDHTDI